MPKPLFLTTNCIYLIIIYYPLFLNYICFDIIVDMDQIFFNQTYPGNLKNDGYLMGYSRGRNFSLNSTRLTQIVEGPKSMAN